MRITRPSITIIAGAFSLAASCLAPLPTEAATTYLWGFTGYFGAGDGANPEGGVIADPSGTLYGTTSNGGAYHVGSGTNGGTVFKLTAPAAGQTQWSETTSPGCRCWSRRGDAEPGWATTDPSPVDF